MGPLVWSLLLGAVAVSQARILPHKGSDHSNTIPKNWDPDGKLQLCGDKLNAALLHHCDGKLSPSRNTDYDPQTKGIVEECCLEKCTWRQLDKYCLEPKFKVPRPAASSEKNDLRRRSQVADNLITKKTLTKHRKINETGVPTMEVGTIPPDQFGGNPVVVVAPRARKRS